MIDYLPKTSEQLLGFIYSVGIGLALGFVYGLLRILFFILSGSDKKFTLTRDIIFLLFCLTVTFFFFLIRYNGKVMFFAVAGELLGGYGAFKLTDSFISYLIRKILRKLRQRISGFVLSVRRKAISFVRKIQNCKKNIIKVKNDAYDLSYEFNQTIFKLNILIHQNTITIITLNYTINFYSNFITLYST